MNNVFITAVTGPDNPRVIRSLAKATRDLGGEWISSKVMKLDGHFAAIMKVNIADTNEQKLKDALAQEFPELNFTHAAVKPADERKSKSAKLEIDTKDRSGLTKEIDEVLSNLDLVVNNMEIHRILVTTLGETVFNAKLDLTIPEEKDPEILADEIEALISSDVRVSVI